MTPPATEPLYDPLEGVTAKTTKEELMNRLREAAAKLRASDRRRKSSLDDIEKRLKAKGLVKHDDLKQVVVSATMDEWKQSVEFLEEFADLLPTPLQRMVIGGRVLLGQIEAAG